MWGVGRSGRGYVVLGCGVVHSLPGVRRSDEPVGPVPDVMNDSFLSPGAVNDPFMTIGSARGSQPAAVSAARARQPRAFSRFPHTRIEHHVRDRLRDSS